MWWFILEKLTNIDMCSKIPKVGVKSRLDIDYVDIVLKPTSEASIINSFVNSFSFWDFKKICLNVALDCTKVEVM